MGVHKRTGKETVVGFDLEGQTSDKLRSYIVATGDNSTWQGPDGETDRGDRYSQRRSDFPQE